MKVCSCLLLFALVCLSDVEARAQSCEITAGGISCFPQSKTLSWSGDQFEGVWFFDEIVGCYAPVYVEDNWTWSPTTYYSPGPAIGDGAPTSPPGVTDGSESAHVPLNGPDGGTLAGCFVWFEYGYWDYSLYTGRYYWFSYGALCDWYWVPNTGGTCFAQGTQVLTPTGPRLIEHLKAGDALIATSQADRAFREVRTIHQVVESTSRLVKVVVAGEAIHTTPEHPFYSRDSGWVPARSLLVGESIQTSRNNWIKVESVSDGTSALVYNLLIDGKSAYFVGDEKCKTFVCVSDACNMFKPAKQAVDNPTIRILETLNARALKRTDSDSMFPLTAPTFSAGSAVNGVNRLPVLERLTNQ